jgi:hypothetical protein
MSRVVMYPKNPVKLIEEAIRCSERADTAARRGDLVRAEVEHATGRFLVAESAQIAGYRPNRAELN